MDPGPFFDLLGFFWLEGPKKRIALHLHPSDVFGSKSEIAESRVVVGLSVLGPEEVTENTVSGPASELLESTGSVMT